MYPALMKGLFPILSMPFDDDGQIDVEDLQREVDYVVGVPVDGVGVAFGSEVNKLSEAERELVTRSIVEQARRRIPVVINTGAPATDLAILYSRRAEELGADAIMLTPPATAATADLVVEYYRRVSEAVTIPIFIQDAGTVPVAATAAAQAAREGGNVRYAKVETPPTPERIAAYVEAVGDSLVVFGGASGSHIIEEMRRGSVGTMPHCAYLEMFRRVIDLFDASQETEAAREFNRHTPLFRNGASGLWGTKEILRLKGIFKTVHVRHPASPPNAQIWREFRELVETLGIATPGTA